MVQTVPIRNASIIQSRLIDKLNSTNKDSNKTSQINESIQSMNHSNINPKTKFIQTRTIPTTDFIHNPSPLINNVPKKLQSTKQFQYIPGKDEFIQIESHSVLLPGPQNSSSLQKKFDSFFSSEDSKVKKKKCTIIVAIGLLLLVIVIGITVYLLCFNHHQSNPNNYSNYNLRNGTSDLEVGNKNKLESHLQPTRVDNQIINNTKTKTKNKELKKSKSKKSKSKKSKSKKSKSKKSKSKKSKSKKSKSKKSNSKNHRKKHQLKHKDKTTKISKSIPTKPKDKNYKGSKLLREKKVIHQSQSVFLSLSPSSSFSVMDLSTGVGISETISNPLSTSLNPNPSSSVTDMSTSDQISETLINSPSASLNPNPSVSVTDMSISTQIATESLSESLIASSSLIESQSSTSFQISETILVSENNISSTIPHDTDSSISTVNPVSSTITEESVSNTNTPALTNDDQSSRIIPESSSRIEFSSSIGIICN